jgi:hypothetical protein
MMPSRAARLWIGAIAERIVRAPLLSPDPPIPATALPTMSMFDDRAVPQSTEPSSKRHKKARNVYYANLVCFWVDGFASFNYF